VWKEGNLTSKRQLEPPLSGVPRASRCRSGRKTRGRTGQLLVDADATVRGIDSEVVGRYGGKLLGGWSERGGIVPSLSLLSIQIGYAGAALYDYRSNRT